MAGTGLSKNLVSSSARSGVSGDPVDPGRVEIFESLYHERVKKGYSGYPDKNITRLAYRKKSSFLAGEKRKEAFHEYVYLLAKRYYQSYLNFSA